MMNKTERRRLERAEAEVERLRHEHERQGAIIRDLMHRVVRLGLAANEARQILDEVRDD